jgi:hypothetical protein
MLYIVFQNSIFYTGYVAALVSSSMYGVLYYARFRELHDSLSLLLPDSKPQESEEPLNIDVEDRSLKIRLYYEQGSGFERIRNELGMNHVTTVQRELRKGLRFLVIFYSEHKQEVKT